jgi:broad specificity phosphatase PhoE
VVATQIHLVRHGEVFNPGHVLYGRIPGFGLSEHGHRMAAAAADDLKKRGRPVSGIHASPLQRTQESAAPISAAFNLPIVTEQRLIEPMNYFEGKKMPAAMRNPRNWWALHNPFRPSWGESYRSISTRMYAAIRAAWESVDNGDVVLVSHQLPIWTIHRSFAGLPLYHNPGARRCDLSSITTFELTDTPSARNTPAFVEVNYTNPASALSAHATDLDTV